MRIILYLSAIIILLSCIYYNRISKKNKIKLFNKLKNNLIFIMAYLAYYNEFLVAYNAFNTLNVFNR